MNMQPIYVLGVGMTPFGRLLDLDVKQLTRAAVDEALCDAGVAASDIQAAYFSNATQGHMEGQHMVRGEIALRSMGIGGIPVVNVENACASGSTALQLAITAVKAGDVNVALAVGAEKTVSRDRDRMFSVFTVHGTSRHSRRTFADCWSSAKESSRPQAPHRINRTACSWTSTRRLPVFT